MDKSSKGRFFFGLALTVSLAASLLITACEESSDSNSGLGDGTGKGGSTARMTIAGDYLYAIAESDIQLFDISQPDAPNPWSRVSIAWDIETLFPHEDYLLVGASSGVYIMDNSDQANPFQVGEINHVVARDPVVAADGYAYVTLREGINEMQVIDISDVTRPTEVFSQSMQYPSGLSVLDGTLYVCDDVAGLKLFDLSDPARPLIRETIRDVACNDVIAHNLILYVITPTELLQYDLRGTSPVLLSRLSVGGA